MACTGTAYATADEFKNFWRADTWDQLEPIPLAAVDAEIDAALELTASNIDVALAAADACSCSLPVWANNFLKKINIIEAGILGPISCGPALDPGMRDTYMEWVNDWLMKIMDGTVDICGGLGKNQPIISYAEINQNIFTQSQIEINRILRDD